MKLKIMAYYFFVFGLLILCSIGVGGNNLRLNETTNQLNLIDHDPILITNDSDLMGVSVSGDGTDNDPYVIRDLNITDETSNYGIMISGISKHVTILNNHLKVSSSSNSYGIYVDVQSDSLVRIIGNQINNADRGIHIQSGTHTIIANNSVFSSISMGISVTDGAEFATIQQNFVNQVSGVGIRTESASSLVSGNVVIGSQIESDSDVTGISADRDKISVVRNVILSCGNGIEISPVNSVIISNNQVQDCSTAIEGWPNNSVIQNNTLLDGRPNGIGISVNGEVSSGSSNGNNFTWNWIENMPQFGFNLFGNGQDNLITNNCFIQNNLSGSSQAFDDGISNTFSNNYWDEWTTPDINQDGIVDVGYQIGGKANNIDGDPLVANPIKESPSHYSFADFTNNTNPITDAPQPGDKELISPSRNTILLVFAIPSIALLAVPLQKSFSSISTKRGLKETKSLVSELVGSSALMAGIIKTEDTTTEANESLLSELVNYKSLLNPVKLAILKILYDYSNHPSFMVRDMIQIPWGQFTPHVNTLISMELIEAKDEFFDGSPTRVLYITTQGLREFETVKSLLEDLFNI